MDKKIPVVAVTGPTATGKTDLAIRLAARFDGEIVSCDSMQIYKGPAIGTAKPSAEELSLVKHHMLDFLDISTDFSVSDYKNMASEVIKDVYSRGKLPVVCGGTGLYARTLLKGVTPHKSSRNDEIKEKLIYQAAESGIEDLYRQLQQLDPAAAEKIHPNNHKRVIRALEYCLATGEQFSSEVEKTEQIESDYRYIMLCLVYRDRQLLYDRINTRVDRMLEQGLLEEAKAFYERIQEMDRQPTAAQAIGYKELFPYFKGETDLNAAIENLKQGTRRYAKRQLTWFKKEDNIRFLYVDDYKDKEELFEAAAKQTNSFLSQESEKIYDK